MIKRDHVFTPEKLKYIKGNERPDVDCILCSIVKEDPKVKILEILRTDYFIISANLYPYNPGHIMIFPIKHIENITEFNTEEILELHNLQILSMKKIKEIYGAFGFNIGYNIGLVSGASIAHLHLHIVPRYPKETGFMDIIGGARIYVEDPKVTVQKLKQAFKNE